MLEVEEIAPDFELLDQDGTSTSLTALVAEGELILYFYPADFTRVCTAEACAFRDNYDNLESLGIQVVGISPQDEESHSKFASKYSIPFPLLCDEGKETIKAYGVNGPFDLGVRRATFLIDQEKRVQSRVVSDLFVGNHIELLEQTIQARAKV